MVFFGSLLALDISLPLNPMPILLPGMLALFAALSVYHYVRGYRECAGCSRALERNWVACPRCGGRAKQATGARGAPRRTQSRSRGG